MYHCPKCGTENAVLVSFPPEQDLGDARSVLTIQWAEGGATIEQMAAVRKVFAEYLPTSMKVQSKLFTAAALRLGPMAKGEAVDLQEVARAVGLSVQLTDES